MQRNKRNHNHKYHYQPKRGHSSERSYGVLPPPGILESYEEISPGAVAKILDMARSEQEHRHKWENNYLRAMGYTVRVGILLEFALAIIILFVCIMFSSENKVYLASLTIICGFGFLTAAAFIASYTKKYMLRPRRIDENEQKS